MILSFKCKHTEALFENKSVVKFRNFERIALRKLKMLDAAYNLLDLKVPPGNRLEKLNGNREEQYSIRINQQYRVCFKWVNGNAYYVEIVDYH